MTCFGTVFVFEHHSPHRANRGAIAAALTIRFSDWPVVKGGDHTLEATPGEAQDSYAQPLPACPNAPAAEYALVGVVGKDRAA